MAYFVDRRDALRQALDAEGRDAASFSFAGQLNVSTDSAGLRRAREAGLEFIRVGADHLTLGIPAREGPSALELVAREVAEPIRDAAGRA